MKTLRLTRAESAAYTNGERRFWQALDLRKQGFDTAQPHEHATWCRDVNGEWEWWGQKDEWGRALLYQWRVTCPYGKPGDRIELVMRDCPGAVQATITRVTVKQRNGRWGWVVEVGA